ncbi:MAG TPA: hypothetical protein VJY62_10175 [Bacteroidia bacterium]|nr:hypothetical protein [Bacteroidia bacterium]
MRTAIIILFFTFLFIPALFAQVNLKEKEKELKIAGDSILKGSSDSVRSLSALLFRANFEDLLHDPASFNYAFDSLKNVSVLLSGDKKVRIYTWILPSISKDKYTYFGFVQLYDKKLNKVTLFNLEDTILPTEEAEKKSLTAKNWYGALYYKIIENKLKGAKIYTLLGWRGNNRQTTIKVIDVLVLNKEIPKFGVPVFKTEKGFKHRIIFEYTSQAVMSLRYNEKKKMIVFDHLSPSNPDLKGKYEYYGPDMTYDAFKFKSGKWNFLKNIEIGNASEYDVKTQNPKAKPKEFYTPPK